MADITSTGPLSLSLDDPELMKSLGMPASPITGSGQDPDEMRAMMPSRPSQPSSAQAAAAMGGGGATPPMPASQAPTDPNDIAKQAMTQQLSAGNKLMATGDEMQDDPAITASQQRLAADRAAMPNASDPQYKPSFGTRVLRGLRGAGLGLAEHGIFGAGLGAIDPGLIPGGKAYGAPNDAYDAAQGAQEKKIADDTQSQTDLLANFKRSQDLLKSREGAYNEGGQTFDKTASAANTAADLPNKTTTAQSDLIKAQADAAKVALETPEAKDAAQRALIAQRTNQANMDPTLKKPGYLRSRFILTGEFQPSHDLNAADVEQSEVTKLTAAWQQQHPGQKPGFEDLQKIYQSVRGSGAAGAGAQDRDLRSAMGTAERHLATLERIKGGQMYSMIEGPEKEKFDNDYATAQQEYQDLQTRVAQGPNPPSASGSTPVSASAPVPPKPVQPASGDQVFADANGKHWILRNGQYYPEKGPK
jgi:hypothetical protein